jgi:hypothetical protein
VVRVDSEDVHGAMLEILTKKHSRQRKGATGKFTTGAAGTIR